MKNIKNTPSWAWDLYQAKQEAACRCPNDATEEVLNYLERVITAGTVPESPPVLEQMIDNHLAGHRQKLRRRSQLLENNAHLLMRTVQSAHRTSDCVSIIRGKVSHLQWQLLTGLANGHSYLRLATDCGLTVASAKSNVCRVRKRLRTLPLAA
jgi:hypothetical protein